MDYATPISKTKSGRIQPKLSIGQPGDQFEREADQMADKVVTMPQPEPRISRKCEDCEEEALQMQPLSKTNTPVIQRKCDVDSAVKWYKDTEAGQKIRWTEGLVDELHKVVGNADPELVNNAKNEGVIGPDFVALACAAQRMLGFSGKGEDGKIGPKTIAAWEKWKTGGEKGIDYTRLLEDKKLEIGIAVGQDFHDTEFVAIEQLLLDNGIELDTETDTKKTYKGKKMYKVQGDNTAPQVEIEVIIDLISSESTDPKETFTEFLSEKEITIYSGHARYGTGPDFDPEASVAENFVIGVNSALHETGVLTEGYNEKINKTLEGKANDLEEMSSAGKFDPDLYQVWFFNACSTIHYQDEIRKGLVTDSSGTVKSKKDLRFMGTKHSIYSDALPIVKGLLEMQTMEEIIAAMDAYEKGAVKKRKEKAKKSYYFAD